MRWKMKSSEERLNAKRQKIMEWHEHFILWPTKINSGEFVFFEKILRRAVRIGEFAETYRRLEKFSYQGVPTVNSKKFRMRYYWEYADTFDLLKK